MSKRAVILAGGKGTRLKPYTVVIPKPLVPVGDHPILEIVVKQLVNHGFNHITLSLGHQAEIIRAFILSRNDWGAKIDFSFENKPLSTMGPLRLIHGLPSDFLVMNGDILTNMDFGKLYDIHKKQKNIFTISAHERTEQTDYGVLCADKHGKLTEFHEKPVRKHLVSMGIYIANKSILKLIPKGTPFGFDQLMQTMLSRSMPVAVRTSKCYWMDIGRPSDYEKAALEFERKKKLFLA